MRTLSVLNSTGDTRITWDPADPAQCANARKEVASLKLAGFVFFLVDGSPADEVTAGGGTLLVRRLEAEEVVAETGPTPDPLVEKVDAAFRAAGHTPGEPRPEAPAEPAATPKRRGRPPKNAPAPDQNVVAVRPLRGG